MIKLYGKNSLYEALKAKAPLKEVFVLQEQSKNLEKLIERVKENNIKLTYTNKDFFNKHFKDNHQGIAAFREDYETYDLDYIFKIDKQRLRILLLDGVNDPHNFGAILRSVDAFGFDAVILGNDRSVKITDAVAHVSTGAIEYTKIIYVNSLRNAVKQLKENNIWIVGTDASADIEISKIPTDINICLIIGSEGFGMSRTLLKESDYICKIPMKGHVNSLNASVSAGILLEKLS